MLRCPYCSASLTIAELRSKRLFRPRFCGNCGRGYIEGGTTEGMALIGIGGAFAVTVSKHQLLPAWGRAWGPLLIVFGFAALALLYSNYTQPRKVEELSSQILYAVIAGPLAAGLFWMALSFVL